jgi:quinol monooxygenase YgiN
VRLISIEERLIKILEKATEDVMQHLPGLSLQIYTVVWDGTKVVNYAQWKSKQAFEDMLQNPKAQKHMNESLSVSQSELHLY